MPWVPFLSKPLQLGLPPLLPLSMSKPFLKTSQSLYPRHPGAHSDRKQDLPLPQRFTSDPGFLFSLDLPQGPAYRCGRQGLMESTAFPLPMLCNHGIIDPVCPMLLISVDDLIRHLWLLPGEKLYKLFVAPSGFAMVAKVTAVGWIAYRMGTFQFFGANKEVMHYREFAGIRRNTELFEEFVGRYQALAENSGVEWIVEDLQQLPTVEEQRAYLAAQGYFEG